MYRYALNDLEYVSPNEENFQDSKLAVVLVLQFDSDLD